MKTNHKFMQAIKRKRRLFIICGRISLKRIGVIVLNDKIFDEYPFNMLKRKAFNARLRNE